MLLDTHIALWLLCEREHLPVGVCEYLAEENVIFFSIASVWETEIKYLAKRDGIPVSGAELCSMAEQVGLRPLGISPQHIAALETLSRDANVQKHNDPFDRLLICQAKSEGMSFLTSDKALLGYNEPCVHYFPKKR